MAAAENKASEAFRTIGELSDELGVPQHILRYWETRFPQLKPLQRSGNRRYYRPADVALARRIHQLLENEGYTIRGVQKLLASKGAAAPVSAPEQPAPVAAETSAIPLKSELRAIRDELARALEEDAATG